MSNKGKRGIFLFIWAALFALAMIFGPISFGGKLKKASKVMSLQKKSLDTLNLRIGDFHNFQKGYLDFQPVIEEINHLFINLDAPIGFIEFLEHEATTSRLQIRITPSSAGGGSPWKSMGFAVNVKGYFSDVQRFLARVENGPWLVDIFQVRVERKGGGGRGGWQGGNLSRLQPSQVSAILIMRAFSQKLSGGRRNNYEGKIFFKT